MPNPLDEKTFESVIEKDLIDENGYLRGDQADYDKRLCLLSTSVIRFLQTTQPEKWESYKDQLGDEAERRICRRIHDIVDRNGTHHLLRNGVQESGHHFDMCYMPPVSKLNPDVEALFQQNFFEVIRDDFKYSEKNEKSLDMVLFLNGCPLFTVELKNKMTGQTVRNAILQYQKDRDPKEPLFHFRRCLTHFAVDTDEVHYTTELKGRSTFFLPFNKGRDGGAGNQPSATGFATEYLWKEVWTRESVLNLIQRFIRVIKDRDNKGKTTDKKKLIFPRFHQLDTVRRLTEHARLNGVGHQYLNQHSAGSGKTICIATLANSLAVLHNDEDAPVFNTVIVVSDRRVIDRQLQNDLRDFTDTPGLLENIDQNSMQLKEALENGKKIIVTTMQKFPVILQELGTLRQEQFALIIDEAHSSQAGRAAGQLNEALAHAWDQEDDDESDRTWEDKINDAMKAVGRLPHVSYFAFTATPKKETLELFGAKQSDGGFKPFSLYTMRQAIDEGFILDVLKNYTTYEQYFNLLKTVEDDPMVDRVMATQLLKRFVSNQNEPIKRKSSIMVDHFRQKVESNMRGKAKAMIVANSRANAVRYCLNVREHLGQQGASFEVLVAFTGTVKLPERPGEEFTEANMNGFPDTQTADQFELDDRRILVVANKFQTGFNQPLLQAMYVDRKLRGVTAVQTLSRLNRIHPDKWGTTFVLDFENDAEDIRDAFQKYYDRIELTAATDPNTLYDIRTDLNEAGIYTLDHISDFAKIIVGDLSQEKKRVKIEALLGPIVESFKALEEDDRVNFRSKIRDYVKLYAFLSQIITFQDKELHKLYVFAEALSRQLPPEDTQWPTEILRNVDLDAYKPELIATEDLGLERGEVEVDPTEFGNDASVREEVLERLSRILEELNNLFGTSFDDEDRVVLDNLQRRIRNDPFLNQQRTTSSRDAVRAGFEGIARELLSELIDNNFRFYQKVSDDEQLRKFLFDKLFEQYYSSTDTEPPDTEPPETDSPG